MGGLALAASGSGRSSPLLPATPNSGSHVSQPAFSNPEISRRTPPLQSPLSNTPATTSPLAAVLRHPDSASGALYQSPCGSHYAYNPFLACFDSPTPSPAATAQFQIQPAPYSPMSSALDTPPPPKPT